nr:hypothetical protein [Novosphingobium sp. B-7]
MKVIPRAWKEIQTLREKYSCRDCETIAQPPAPFHVVPRSGRNCFCGCRPREAQVLRAGRRCQCGPQEVPWRTCRCARGRAVDRCPVRCRARHQWQ